METNEKVSPVMTDVIVPTIKPQREVLGLVEEIRETAGIPVRIRATCQNLSAAKNRNLGLIFAESPVIIMVDDDVTGFPHGWAARMVQVMNNNPNCVMCSPRLMRPNGEFGFMTGMPTEGHLGCEVLPSRELCTACIAIRNTSVRFDEAFVGSGFEDNDYCRALVREFPAAQFICIHDLRVIHKNERKRQGGEFWARNEEYYKRKWGLA